MSDCAPNLSASSWSILSCLIVTNAFLQTASRCLWRVPLLVAIAADRGVELARVGAVTARKQFVVAAEGSNDASGDGTSIECFDDEHGASGGARVRLVCGAHEMWLWLLFIVVQSWTGMHSLAAGGGRALGMAAIVLAGQRQKLQLHAANLLRSKQ